MAERPIENLLTTEERVPPPSGVARWASIPDQDAWNAAASRDPIEFWRACGEGIAWAEPPHATLEGGLGNARWFVGGRLNATVSCLDRHVATHPDAVAFHYLREDGLEATTTYSDLLASVNRFANALLADGVTRGDSVCIYMPLSVEGIVAMLACARIGAVHSVVYAGLGATALRDRIEDAGAEVVIGADVTYRRGREIDLKKILDDAVRDLARVRRVVVWRRDREPAALTPRERDFEEYAVGRSASCEPVIVAANDPLFILYTSGTTGKPKGVVMSHGGYLAGTAEMLRYTTDLTPDDVYLVHERHRLDRRTFTNRIRCAREPLSFDHPRGRARLSVAVGRVRNDRATPRDETLHRADARAHADALRSRSRRAARPLVAAGDLLRGRAVEPRSVAFSVRDGRRPERGGLQSVVADRDGCDDARLLADQRHTPRP